MLMENEPGAARDDDPPVVVFVYPSSWTGPLVQHPSAWHLKADEPEEALKRFAARRRIRCVVC